MSGIESFISLSLSCFLNPWKNICSQNKDDHLLLQSPRCPLLPVHSFLRLFVEVNRTFFLLAIALTLTAVKHSEKKNAVVSIFHLFQDKKQAKQSTSTPAKACGLVS